MIRDAILALGLLLSTATQFRMPGAPFGLGPGEILLLSWMLATSLDLVAHRNPAVSPAVSRMLLFWAVFALAECLGQLVGLAIEPVRDTAGAMRTTQAYVLVAVLSCLVVTLPEVEAHLRRVTLVMVGCGALATSGLIGGAYGKLPSFGLSFWLYDRFIGWSINPNQAGLSCTVLALLALHLAETEARTRTRLFALACAVPPFIAGILTRSDSFTLAVLAAGPVFLGMKLLQWAFLDDRGRRVRSVLASFALFSMTAALLGAAPFMPAAIEKAQESAVAMMEQNDQAEDRFALWRAATEIGLDAAMMGMGPGPHITSKAWKFPPPELGEAHNTVLDLFTQGGVLAVAVFLWITAVSVLTTMRAGLIACLALILALFVFSSFHLVLRHPIFWFSIVISLVSADAAMARRRRAARVAARVRGTSPADHLAEAGTSYP